jgi:hypothetical protein
MDKLVAGKWLCQPLRSIQMDIPETKNTNVLIRLAGIRLFILPNSINLSGPQLTSLKNDSLPTCLN